MALAADAAIHFEALRPLYRRKVSSIRRVLCPPMPRYDRSFEIVGTRPKKKLMFFGFFSLKVSMTFTRSSESTSKRRMMLRHVRASLPVFSVRMPYICSSMVLFYT